MPEDAIGVAVELVLPQLARMVRFERNTLVLAVDEARRAGLGVPIEMAWLTIAVQSSLEAVGLSAAFSARLADGGIPCNVLAGLPRGSPGGTLPTGSDLDVSPGRAQTYPAMTTPVEGFVMSWLVLIISGVLETVWAVALAESDGFRNLRATVVFSIALLFSMSGLAFALRDIPVGTGYAVWVGIGAVGTAAWGMAVQGDAVTALRLICLLAIVAGVVGLKLAH